MKKYSSIVVVALVIVATAAIFFVGCKKEKDKAVTQPEKTLMDKIKVFQTIRESVNSGIKTDDVMTIEEMRQYLCLVSNYEHSEHETHCINTTLDTIYITMPEIDSNGNIHNVDVVTVYNEFEKALEECIASINDGRCVLGLFSIMLPRVAKDNNYIRIVFTRGREGEQKSDPPTVNGPIEDLCLIWGLDLGYCDSNNHNIAWDAADELSTYFTPDNTNPGNGAIHIFTDVEYVEYIATNTFMITNPYSSNYTYWTPAYGITPCVYWLFYQSGIINGPEPCLCEDEMNCEWSSINDFIVANDSTWHNSPNYNSPYYYCVVRDNILIDKLHGDSICDRYHTALVCYAKHYWTDPNIE